MAVGAPGPAARPEGRALRVYSRVVEALVGGAMAARQEHAFPDAAVTLIGVQSLFTPDMLVEVEVVAAKP